MIINNLLIKLKERNNETIMKTKAALLSMEGKIETLRDLQVEVDIRNSESSYDILLVTKFDSMEDMDLYLVHPIHIEVSKYILSVMETGSAVCYES